MKPNEGRKEGMNEWGLPVCASVVSLCVCKTPPSRRCRSCLVVVPAVWRLRASDDACSWSKREERRRREVAPRDPVAPS